MAKSSQEVYRELASKFISLASSRYTSQEVYRELAREMNLLVRLTRQLPSAAAN